MPWLGGSADRSTVLYTKGCGFDSWSGYIPRLQVQSLVGARTEGNQSMFLSLPLSLKSINISLAED